MKITLKNVPISELTSGYKDMAESGVTGFGGKLNIRPAFQREFIYKERQRNEVIHTVTKGFPLNMMYWAVAGDDFELLDGQQRTISICQYVNNDFSVIDENGLPKFFENLTPNKQKQILDYEITIYLCDGDADEKLSWFRIINIAGEKLTEQELRNAVYTGTWLTAAKAWFSRTGCPAYQLGERYMHGSPIRQDYLEKSLEWIAHSTGISIEDYMSAHQHDADSQELWQYFQEVIAWVQRLFPEYRKKIMQGLDWGVLYNVYGRDRFNAVELEQKIVVLINDDEVDNKRGICEYLLTGREKLLNLRTFGDKARIVAYEQQKGICPVCNDPYAIDVMEADHITPWSKGGKTVQENCQMLCQKDNRAKSAA